jgi:hypothetical protein
MTQEVAKGTTQKSADRLGVVWTSEIRIRRQSSFGAKC